MPGRRESGIFMADTHSRAKQETRETRWWFSNILFSLSSFPLVFFLLFIPARLTHGARYWINNALITFRGTTNVAAGSEFPNYTPWQITRIKFSRMREFAYRNDGIPRDVIHPRLFRPSECSLCGSRHTSGWDREKRRIREFSLDNFLIVRMIKPSTNALMTLSIDMLLNLREISKYYIYYIHTYTFKCNAAVDIVKCLYWFDL